jgi:NhaP-type Na+/H+ or K+/H+ antiporter
MNDNKFVKIAGTIGGLMVAMAALVLILAQDQAEILIYIVAAMAIMGIVLGYFAFKTNPDQKIEQKEE